MRCLYQNQRLWSVPACHLRWRKLRERGRMTRTTRTWCLPQQGGHRVLSAPSRSSQPACSRRQPTRIALWPRWALLRWPACPNVAVGWRKGSRGNKRIPTEVTSPSPFTALHSAAAKRLFVLSLYCGRLPYKRLISCSYLFQSLHCSRDYASVAKAKMVERKILSSTVFSSGLFEKSHTQTRVCIKYSEGITV